ncbi:uncharacterized protein LOC141627739 [Silene latifolia]|uniref:uncharacterized protein LOC141627739 n=1 Tax=Silene latifolia TaxID=37657 RepID=UPI003D780021
MSVTTYYGKLKLLWDALAIHKPPVSCKCGRCTCEISSQAVQRLDNERLHQFFMGLDPSFYGTLHNQQFQLDPLPTPNRGYHVVLQVESWLLGDASASSDASDVMAFAIPGASRISADLKALHWWGSRPRTLAEFRRSKGLSASSGVSSASGGSGASTSGTNSLVRANVVHTAASITSSDCLSGKCISWIIDTGASNHVTGDLSLLTDCTVIPPRPVGLPNGHRILAAKMETVCISDQITLRRVLFIPNMTCNLISVSQLTNDADYTLQFAKDSCLIHDRSSRMMIGVGELQDGLYFSKTRGDKFEPRSRRCIFLGYPHNKKGWKVYDLETDTFLVSHDVHFYEDKFPFSDSSTPIPPIEPTDLLYDDDLATSSQEPPTPTSPTTPDPTSTSSPLTVEEVTTDPESSGQEASAVNEMGHGHRVKIPNSRLRDYVLTSTDNPSSPSSPTYAPSSSGTPYALANFVNCHKFSSRHRSFLTAVTAGTEPPSFHVAIRDDGWCKAMQEEINALKNNGTWELSDLPHGKKALGCRWVNKIKYKLDGTIERLKARLVVFGNHEVEGIDYGEIFVHVVKIVTIRTFLAVAAVKKWELHQNECAKCFFTWGFKLRSLYETPSRVPSGA